MALDISKFQSATTNPSSVLNDVIDAGVQAYLNTTLVNAIGHQVAMGVLGSTSFMNSMLARSRSGGVYSAGDSIARFANNAVDELNQYLQLPNIEGITIYASQTSVSREVEASSTPVIQQSISARKYVTDSATPLPRTFTVQGYLQSMAPELDYGKTIRPSIVAQAKYLDSCASSRCPVWYKDDYNRFFLVLITRYREEHSADVTNLLKVDIEMAEYIPYEASESLGQSFMVDGMNTLFNKAVRK